jgi:Tol biopolymer transport system component
MSNKTNTKMFLIILLAVLISMSRNANADFVFGTPTKLGPAVNSSAAEGDTSISSDGLSLFFMSDRSGGYGGRDIWVTTRETIESKWSVPMNLGPIVNGSSWDMAPDVSADGLTLYFASNRAGGYGGFDIWATTRATKDDPWEEPVNLGSNVNSWSRDFAPNISADGLKLYYTSDYPYGGFGNDDLWLATRSTTDKPWPLSVNLGPTINSSHHEAMPDISADGLTLFFSDHMGAPFRPGGQGGQDIWFTTRVTTNDPWGEPVNLGPIVNSSSFDFSPNISADGSTLYLTSDRGGAEPFEVVDIWQVKILPVVDFNEDGIVDSADVCMMVDHWHTDEPLCDIGPMPWGDGIVDVQDLIVLAEHFFEEIPPVE